MASFGGVEIHRWLTVSFCLLSGLLWPSVSLAQELEPRSYFNLPVGANFLLFGAFRTRGAVLPDPTPALEDVDATIDGSIVGYARTLGIGQRSGKISLGQPLACMDATGSLRGVSGQRDVCGPGDTNIKFSYNFIGAPALSWAEFRKHKPGFVMGAGLRLQAPTGQYDGEKLINIGANRWRIQPELGISQRVKRWWFELSGNVSLYTDNHDFADGMTREQAPVYGLQWHIIRGFAKGIWLALDGNYFVGGASTVDGQKNDDQFANSRVGLTLSMPISRRHSVKFYAVSGVVTREGADEADTLGFAYQYGWGKDFPH